MTDREAKTAYETNLTDDQWVAIEPLLQEAKPWGGRPIKVNLREVVNALLSMNRTGCQSVSYTHLSVQCGRPPETGNFQ